MSGMLRWGVLGTGNIAKQFAGGVRTARRSQIVAVGSRSADAAEVFGETYGVESRWASYEELLADERVDAVYNSLPNSMHFEWTVKALRAGKHVLCEKPFAMDLQQSEEMFAEAERQERVLIEAFMYRTHPLTRAVMETVRSGAMGEVKAVRTSFCYRTQKIEGNVRFDHGLGGGGLMDVGCYCINFARMVIGEEPKRVCAAARFHKGSGVDEVVSGIMAFPGGAVSTFIAGMALQADNTATIAGTEGYIEVPVPWKPPVKGAVYVIARGTPPKMDAGKLAAPVNPRETRTVDAGKELYALEADAFAEVVLDGARPFVTREDTLGNMRVLDEMRREIGLKW